MLLRLVSASLFRHRARTVLAVLGVAVSAALLLDMVMLSTGMSESFRTLLLGRGFQLRAAPKGTLPFDTEATIADASAVMAAIGESADVEAISPVLGATVHLPLAHGGALSTLALGVIPAVQGDYALETGRDPYGDHEIVGNRELLARAAIRVGDSLTVAGGYDAQLRRFAATRRALVTGQVRFLYLARDQAAVAMPIAALQSLGGERRRDRASLLMIRARAGADIEGVRSWIGQRVPHVTPISIATALAQVEERLSYFRQLAVILGAVSLTVGVLLVATLVTVSVNERIGEFAVLRAIGVARSSVTKQVMLESAAIMGGGSLLGLGLGLITARYLNTILSSFPGLPAAIDFFLFQPRAAWAALGMLAVAGVLAGLWPAWRGASLPVARTLREEAR
jgi:putative ABC transport system permease protein